MRHVVIFLLTLSATLFVGRADASTVPPEDWFETEAAAILQSYASSVFPDMTSTDHQQLTIGSPVGAVSLDEDSSDPRRALEADSYVAPIRHGSTIVGAISYILTEDGGEGLVEADAYLGQHIAGLDAGELLVRDPANGAHYIIRGDSIVPASTPALNYLAGSTSIESFLQLRAELMDEGNNTTTEPTPRDIKPVVMVGIILVAFLIITAVLTWLRRIPGEPVHHENEATHKRPVRIYRRGGKRVNADD